MTKQWTDQDRVDGQEEASYGDERVRRAQEEENRGSTRIRQWHVTARAEDAKEERS
ncbi:MAG TPA: hypothetical protein VNA32_01995 [Actinomycetota bacterium]|nr:hypothetical protein [Actinomycetota bacterium]